MTSCPNSLNNLKKCSSRHKAVLICSGKHLGSRISLPGCGNEPFRVLHIAAVDGTVKKTDRGTPLTRNRKRNLLCINKHAAIISWHAATHLWMYHRKHFINNSSTDLSLRWVTIAATSSNRDIWQTVLPGILSLSLFYIPAPHQTYRPSTRPTLTLILIHMLVRHLSLVSRWVSRKPAISIGMCEQRCWVRDHGCLCVFMLLFRRLRNAVRVR